MFLIIQQCSLANTGNIAMTTVLEHGNTGYSWANKVLKTVQAYTAEALHMKSWDFQLLTKVKGNYPK